MKTTNKPKKVRNLLCATCKKIKVLPINGFKTWQCKNCKERALANSSVIPVYCQTCAESLNGCERCGVDLN